MRRVRRAPTAAQPKGGGRCAPRGGCPLPAPGHIAWARVPTVGLHQTAGWNLSVVTFLCFVLLSLVAGGPGGPNPCPAPPTDTCACPCSIFPLAHAALAKCRDQIPPVYMDLRNTQVPYWIDPTAFTRDPAFRAQRLANVMQHGSRRAQMKHTHATSPHVHFCWCVTPRSPIHCAHTARAVAHTAHTPGAGSGRGALRGGNAALLLG